MTSDEQASTLMRNESNRSIQGPWRLLGIIGEDPSVSKSNWLHVVSFQFSFISLR
jgi:hypothetical protein